MDNCTNDIRNKQVINFIISDRYRVLRHIVFLTGLMLSLLDTHIVNEFTGIYKYLCLICIYVVYVTLFYVNMYVLVPLFFFDARYILYLLLLIILILGGIGLIWYVLNYYFEVPRIPYAKGRTIVNSFYGGTMVSIPAILTTTTVKLFQRWTMDNRRISELNDLTLRMELNGLRNQINPHFLFNMLNNVKALIRTDPQTARVVLVKFSEFLRYQLYENDEEKTTLSAEIKFLSNFLSLETIRRDNLSVSLSKEPDNATVDNVLIPPNLFTTFVENAVKYSVNVTGAQAFINIHVSVTNQRLHFRCSNSRSADSPARKGKSGGLGLANISRRLELLYRDNYMLDIKFTDTVYTVDLIIPI